MFVRNEQANTFFKQCITCRTRQNIRRQTLRHQLSAALPQTEEAGTVLNSVVNAINETSFQPITNTVEVELEQLNSVDTNNVVSDINFNSNTNFVHCKGCRKDCAPALFTDLNRGTLFKQCLDCRYRSHIRRHPEASLARVVNEPRIAINLNETPERDNASNIIVNTDKLYCAKCKRNCPAYLFNNNSANTFHATCCDCRRRDLSRRYPTVFEPIPTQLPIQLPINNNNDDLYDARHGVEEEEKLV